MAKQDLHLTRNFGIMAHIDAGKTTTSPPTNVEFSFKGEGKPQVAETEKKAEEHFPILAGLTGLSLAGLGINTFDSGSVKG